MRPCRISWDMSQTLNSLVNRSAASKNSKAEMKVGSSWLLSLRSGGNWVPESKICPLGRCPNPPPQLGHDFGPTMFPSDHHRAWCIHTPMRHFSPARSQLSNAPKPIVLPHGYCSGCRCSSYSASYRTNAPGNGGSYASGYRLGQYRTPAPEPDPTEGMCKSVKFLCKIGPTI